MCLSLLLILCVLPVLLIFCDLCRLLHVLMLVPHLFPLSWVESLTGSSKTLIRNLLNLWMIQVT